ncbi:MAG TPA: NCS2 family permease [Thermoanaerobaculia bacterium]|nr:NCS2 family permease [Thermoanaerobaculia bacterium]
MPRQRLGDYWGLDARGSSVAVEVRAGLVTFLTMAYILLVNAQILSAAGMPREDVVIATAIASAVATLVMGLWARFPFALAPGMGLNAYFAYTVVGGMGIRWQQALAAVFVAGLLFLVLSVGGIRSTILRAIPRAVKMAIMGGIGLFLALIGLQNAGLVRDHPVTLVTLGELGQAGPLLALAGLAVMAALLARRVPAALLLGIAGVALVAWGLGVAPLPEALVAWPRLPRETLLALDFRDMLSPAMLSVVLAFLFVDLFDTAGTLLGVGRLAGFTDAEGDLPGADRAFLADAVGTSVGALLGTSPVTSYVESATGVEEGGRTGLTAVVVAAMFLAALVFTPLFVAVPAVATAPALVVVGALMMSGLRDIEWQRPDEAIPAFLTVTAMPFTFSIANGIALGLTGYVVIKTLAGRWREVHPLLWSLVVLLVLFYAFAAP